MLTASPREGPQVVQMFVKVVLVGAAVGLGSVAPAYGYFAFSATCATFMLYVVSTGPFIDDDNGKGPARARARRFVALVAQRALTSL